MYNTPIERKISMDIQILLFIQENIRHGSLTLARSQNSQMSFMYGFFFVKFLFFTVVCVVIMI